MAHTRYNWLVLLAMIVWLGGCQAIQASPRPPFHPVTRGGGDPSDPTVKPVALVPTPPATLDPDELKWVERMIDASMAINEIPGFAVGIIKGGQVVYAQGFGVAEQNTERLMTAETLAPLSSLSVQFTAAAAMQLIDQGKLDLQAKVTDYLPDFALADERYPEMTIRHLLSNTSGLTHPDFASAYDFTRRTTSAEALDAYIASLVDRELAASPGEGRFIYSNDNWDILAAIIAEVSGEPYETYISRNLLEPLDMAQSTFFLAAADHELLTASHWLDASGAMVSNREPPHYDQVHSASTGLISNTADMLKWARAHLNRGRVDGVQVVPAAAYDLMWAPQAAIDWGLGGLFEQWGMGWALANEQGHPIAWWGGLDLGSNSMMFLAPEDGIAVIVLANATRESEWLPWYSYEEGYSILQLVLGVELGAT